MVLNVEAEHYTWYS